MISDNTTQHNTTQHNTTQHKFRFFRAILTFIVAALVLSGCPTPEPDPPDPTVPGTMAAPTLESGNAILTATWTAPDDGGSAITGYELQYRTGGGAWTDISGITSASRIITGLTNGNTYEVQVRAVNAQGPSAWSKSAVATPVAVPAAPDAPTLEAGNGEITATWTAPKDNGGSAITEYHVQRKLSADDWPPDNTTSIAAITVAAPATTHTIMNLENGMSYDVRVRAANAQGNGAWSPSQSGGLKFVGAYDESKNFDSLDMAGAVISYPYGIWSDETTMWVADTSDNRKIYAYKVSDKTRMSGSDINLSYQPLYIWSDGETMWVTEGEYGSHANIHAHNKMSNGNFDPMPDTNKSFTVSGAPYPVSGVYSGTIPAGIWSNGTTMWVADTNGSNKKIYAYKLSTGEADSAKDINLSDNLGRLEGIWSDGTTLWILADVTIDDMGTDVMRTRIAAYKMSDGTSDPTKTFTLNDIENTDNTGIWSDGRTMWIASDVNGAGTSTTPPITAGGAKLYAYTLFEEIEE